MNQAKHPERETIPTISQTLAMLVVLVLSCAIFGSCASPAMPKKASGRSLSEQQFLTNVKPLVESRCSWCHSNSNPAGGLNFQDRDTIFNDKRPFITPGSPDTSLIYLALTRPKRHPQVMPGDGWGIAESQLKAIRIWIESGAVWPEGKDGSIHRKAYTVEMDDYL